MVFDEGQILGDEVRSVRFQCRLVERPFAHLFQVPLPLDRIHLPLESAGEFFKSECPRGSAQILGVRGNDRLVHKLTDKGAVGIVGQSSGQMIVHFHESEEFLASAFGGQDLCAGREDVGDLPEGNISCGPSPFVGLVTDPFGESPVRKQIHSLRVIRFE